MRKFKHQRLENVTAKIIETNIVCIESSMGPVFCPLDLVENSKDWVEIFEPKFKNGDVVKNKYGAMYLITDYEKGHGFGFNSSGDWIISQSLTLDSSVNGLKLATKEEWLEALTKEAVKRGLISGVKIDKSKIDLYKNETKKIWVLSGTKYYLSNDYKQLDLGTDVVFENGIWADPIKEETLEELAYRFRRYYEKNTYNTEDALINFFNENKETIHRLSK